MYYSLISSMKKSSFDADAQAFITAAAITNATQQTAINSFVISLKSYGIWTKMKALYPFVGGTASSHKYNLKDPRDLNAAFRLTFSGGWTHSSNGALPNGTNAYADTYLIPSTVMSTGGDHLSYYSRTNSSTNVDYLIGGETGPPYTYLGLVGKRNAVLGVNGRGLYSTSNPTSIYWAARQDNISRDTRGFFVGTSNGANTYYILNNSILANNTLVNTDLSRLTNKLYVAAYPINNSIPSNFYTNKECALASIGNDLTTTEASNFYTAVQAYQTSLSRQV